MSKVLFVHPDVRACETMASVLSQAGHEVQTAREGAAALELFKTSAPDIVVLNHELPGLRPFETFGEIRRSDPEAKVLVFSLAGEAEKTAESPRFGVTPLRPGQLLEAVDLLLRPSRRLAGPAARVLVVDDDPSVREAVSRYLKDKGYEVAAAGDGLEGTALHESFQPQLILLDIDMPKLTGLETLKRIRLRDQDVGVMMITGNDTVEAMEQCRDLGAFDYLFKPFNFGYLEFSVYSKFILRSVTRS